MTGSYSVYGYDFEICPDLEGFRPKEYNNWFEYKRKNFDANSEKKIITLIKGKKTMVVEVFGFDLPTELEQQDGVKRKVFVKDIQTRRYLTIWF